MSIESIRIRGFKTFCDPVVISFSHRLTGVVGPNGSGKSNLVDAIRWGIGEHLPRLLRIGQPQDVIFAGLADRKPLSLAEVSILLDNRSRKYPGDTDKIEILRRIYRDGETEYLINGQKSRVRDVEDLFRGTGLGKQTYSVVGQGEVDQVLSATPAERLQIMEELAGVDVLRSTKRTVENKLEKAHQSMREIDAHIDEQEHQYEHLALQAEVLERYKQIRERHDWAKNQLLLVQLGKHNAELEILNSKQKMSSIKHTDALQELERLESEPEPTTGLAELEREQEKAKAEREGALVIQSRTGAELDHMRTRKDQAAEELGKLTIESETLERRIPGFQKEIDAKKEQSREFEGKVEAARLEVGKAESSRADSSDDQQARKSLQSELDTSKRNADDARARMSSVQSQITVSIERERSTSARLRDLSQLEFEPVTDTTGEERELEAVKEKMAEISESLAITSERLEKAESGFATVSAEAKSVSSQLEKQARILSGITFQPSKSGLVTIPERIDLARFDDFDRKLISSILDWIVSDESEIAKILGLIPKGTDTAVVSGDVTVEVCDDVLHALSSAGRISITRDGYIVVSGIVFPSREKVTESSIKSVISKLESELAGLKVKQESLAKDLDQFRQDRITASKGLEDLRQGEMALSNTIATKLAKSESARKQAEQRQAETEKLTQLASGIKSEIARLEAERDKLTSELQKALDAVRVKGSELAEFDSLRLKRQEENVQVERAIAEARQKLNERQKELDDQARSVAELEKEAQNSVSRLKECKDRIACLETELRNLEQSIIDFERTLNTAKMTVIRTDRLEKEILAKKEEVLASSDKRSSLAKVVRGKITRLSQELHQIELDSVETRVKRETVIAQIIEAGGSLDMPIETTDIEELKAEVSNTSRQLAEYGSVNLSAKDDAKTAQERLNFMKGQLEDLAQAEANLKSALSEVEGRIRNSFEDLFRSVEQHFRRLADVLFPGAVGNLKRMLSEAGETEGVEVEFMLPGRRLKGLHSLSGGEKTLGALALLFAFFKTRSSPFCILDEVDAALDDNNIDRFTRLLDTEAHETQFVIITHNKETMRNCDALYGITLDSTGTSKVVSVKLDAPA